MTHHSLGDTNNVGDYASSCTGGGTDSNTCSSDVGESIENL